MDNEVSETSFAIVFLKNIYILLYNVLFRHLHWLHCFAKKTDELQAKVAVAIVY